MMKIQFLDLWSAVTCDYTWLRQNGVRIQLQHMYVHELFGKLYKHTTELI